MNTGFSFGPLTARGGGEVGVALFAQEGFDSSIGNGLKMGQGRFSWVLRKAFIAGRLMEHWNRLAREVVESPSPEVFRRCIDVVLRDTV